MSRWWRLTCFSALLLFPALVDAEPLSSYSCDIAQEKLVKSQRALKVAETDRRNAKRDEDLIRTELWTCQPGGVFSLARTRRCGRAHDGLPAFMKQTIEATYRVEELEQTIRDRHDWHMKVCAATP